MVNTKTVTFTMQKDAVDKLTDLSNKTNLKKSTIMSLLVQNTDTKTLMAIINKKAKA